MGRGGAATKAVAAAATVETTAHEAEAIEAAAAAMEAQLESHIESAVHAERDAYLASLADRKARLLSLPAEVLSMDVAAFATSDSLAAPTKGGWAVSPDFDAAEAAAAEAAAAKRKIVIKNSEGVEVEVDLASLAPEAAAALEATLAAAAGGGGVKPKKGKK